MTDLHVGLTLAERFALIPILPQKGNCILLERTRELHTRLVPTPAETKDLKITEAVDEEGMPTGGLQWPIESATVEARIEIDEMVNKAIVAKLTELDKTDELTHATSPLYRIFVKSAEPADAEKPNDNGQEPK